MRRIFALFLITVALSACSDSGSQRGTNYILKSNESIYINQQGSKFQLINSVSGESIKGVEVVNDATPVNEIVKDGYLQIKFGKSAFGIPSRVTLQWRDLLPYLCSECSEGMKEWNRKKS
jgi:hypothetical protein